MPGILASNASCAFSALAAGEAIGLENPLTAAKAFCGLAAAFGEKDVEHAGLLRICRPFRVMRLRGQRIQIRQLVYWPLVADPKAQQAIIAHACLHRPGCRWQTSPLSASTAGATPGASSPHVILASRYRLEPSFILQSVGRFGYGSRIAGLKEFARNRLPPEHPLRDVLLAEPDILTPEEFLAKLAVWCVLVNRKS